MRYTKTELRNQVKNLNSISSHIAKEDIEFALEWAYGGVRLCMKDGSGLREISYRTNMQEMGRMLSAMQNVLSNIAR